MMRIIEITTHLLTNRGGIRVTTFAIYEILKTFDETVVKVLLDKTNRRTLKITDFMVRAASENHAHQKEVMMLLIHRAGT
jgi:hypothetical protein